MSKSSSPAVPGSKALEMTMRDVMVGLVDTATRAAYAAESNSVEILSVELPRTLARPIETRPDNVVAVGSARSHSIVDYLIQRETALACQAC
jgi:hypothetical protein